MRARALLGTALVVLGTMGTMGTVLIVAPSANAMPVYRGTGYKLSTDNGTTPVSTTFVLPLSTCDALRVQTETQLGLLSPDLLADAGVRMVCARDGAITYNLVAGVRRSAEGSPLVGQIADVSPGDVVQAEVFPTPSGTGLRARDLTSGASVTVTLQRALTAIVVGGYPYFNSGMQVPDFGTLKMGATVGDGVPFASTDYVRHVDSASSPRRIGIGFPWNDGVHFYLYFRHH